MTLQLSGRAVSESQLLLLLGGKPLLHQLANEVLSFL
jgi:hypothetical protein